MEEQNKSQAQEQPEEVREEIAYISGEYLSAACNMIAWQFIDSKEEPATFEEFRARCDHLMRQHCPQAYAYFFQHLVHPESYILPYGTVDIIRTYIRQQWPTFMGGRPDGSIIIPG